MEKKAIDYKGLRLSPTSVNCYRRCPREFYYSYVLKIPTPPNIHLIKGSAVHKAIENFFRGYKPNMEQELLKLFEKSWEKQAKSIKELNMDDKELKKEKQDCLNILDMFMFYFRKKVEYHIHSGKAQGERHAFYLLKPKFREKFYEDKELKLCGFVDRIHTDFSGITTIADYKTSGRYGPGIKDEYEVQSAIYALLYERCEKKRADFTSIIFLRFGEEVRTRVTPFQIKYALKLIKDVHEGTKSNKIDDYPQRETNFCKYCSYNSKCSGLDEHEREKRLEATVKNGKNKLEKKV